MTKLTEAEIADLVARHPLPDGVADVVCNRDQLAQAFDVSLPTINGWIARGMPVKSEGDRGSAYELQLSHCWAWRQAWLADEQARSTEVENSVRALRLALLGGRTGDTIMALDPRQRRDIIAAQIEHERFERERNQLIPRGEVAEAFDLTFGLIRDVLESAPDRAERETAIPPTAVDALQGVCDELLTEVQNRLAEFWQARPLKSAAKRETLFDA